MSPTDCLGVPWATLAARIEPTRTLERWASAEPALERFRCLDDVAAVLHHDNDVTLGDQILGALVRLAAVDGGDEEDAALLVAHLLRNGTRKLAGDLRRMSRDIDSLIAGALWLRIRTFPWRRRTHAYAKSLLLDTRQAVLAELRPYRSAAGVDMVIPVDPSPPSGRRPEPLVMSVLDRPRWEAQDRAEIRLGDLLEWAQRSGLVRPSDVELLVDLAVTAERLRLGPGEVGRGAGPEVREVARRRGVNRRTIWRHRARALVALRDARERYLAVIA